MKNRISQLFLIVCVVFCSSISAFAYPYSGEYMFTMSGNDWNGAGGPQNTQIKSNIETAIEAWFLAEKSISLDVDLEFYDKVDSPGTNSFNMLVTYTDNYHGSWTTIDPIEFYTVKGSNEFAMYWLGFDGASSGYWSTEHLSAGSQGSVPTVSHLSAYNPTDPVPEPTTMLLFGAGLAGLAAVGRRRKDA